MKSDDIKEAIQSGATTSTEIAEELGKDSSTIRRRAKKLAESDSCDIVREKNPSGGGYVYGIKESGDGDAPSRCPFSVTAITTGRSTFPHPATTSISR